MCVAGYEASTVEKKNMVQDVTSQTFTLLKSNDDKTKMEWNTGQDLSQNKIKNKNHRMWILMNEAFGYVTKL